MLARRARGADAHRLRDPQARREPGETSAGRPCSSALPLARACRYLEPASTATDAHYQLRADEKTMRRSFTLFAVALATLVAAGSAAPTSCPPRRYLNEGASLSSTPRSSTKKLTCLCEPTASGTCTPCPPRALSCWSATAALSWCASFLRTLSPYELLADFSYRCSDKGHFLTADSTCVKASECPSKTVADKASESPRPLISHAQASSLTLRPLVNSAQMYALLSRRRNRLLGPDTERFHLVVSSPSSVSPCSPACPRGSRSLSRSQRLRYRRPAAPTAGRRRRLGSCVLERLVPRRGCVPSFCCSALVQLLSPSRPTDTKHCASCHDLLAGWASCSVELARTWCVF